MSEPPNETDEFRLESARRRPSLLREFWDFLKHNKKWWLLPILISLLILGLLAILGGTSLAPFIYTVF